MIIGVPLTYTYEQIQQLKDAAVADYIAQHPPFDIQALHDVAYSQGYDAYPVEHPCIIPPLEWRDFVYMNFMSTPILAHEGVYTQVVSPIDMGVSSPGSKGGNNHFDLQFWPVERPPITLSSVAVISCRVMAWNKNIVNNGELFFREPVEYHNVSGVFHTVDMTDYASGDVLIAISPI